MDGRRYLRRFVSPAATAATVNRWIQLQAERYLLRWEFDPETREFLDPDRPRPGENGDPGGAHPVFTEALAWMCRRWADWQPKTRQAAARALRRACLTLVRPDPDGQVPTPPPDVERYLDWVLAPPAEGEAIRTAVLFDHAIPPDPTGTGAERWIQEHSRPFAEVTWSDLERLAQRYATNQRVRGGRRVSPATERRMLADLHQFWADTADRLELSANPWNRRALQRRPNGRSSGMGVRALDPDVVLAPAEVWDLALCCSRHATESGVWGAEVVGFVLLMGWCGLRPGEAAAARISALRLPATGPGWGELTIANSRRSGVPDRWRDPEEDEEEGPLKWRAPGESRSVPVPPELVELLTVHSWLCCRADSDLLFVRQSDGAPFDLNAFDTAIWQPARAEMFPATARDVRGQKLAHLRRHDLRHAACSAWLAAGVNPKVAQVWSGHRRLSVFLDIYQGLLPTDEAVARKQWQTYLEAGGQRGTLAAVR